jgi:hypothetical protein
MKLYPPFSGKDEWEKIIQPERSKREDSCKHDLYPHEFKEGEKGYIYRKCKKCNSKLYAENL